MSKVEELKAQLNDVLRLGQAGAILGWDQQVNMPPGGAAARAEQLATIGKLAHEMFVTDEVGKLIEAAEAEVKDADYDSDEAAMVRVVRHDYDLQTRIPTKLVEELARTQALAHEAWAKAREANDFPSFVPVLEKIFDLMRQQADALGYEDRPYDALLDQYEPNMKTADVERLFDDLRTDLVPFVADIFENLDKVDDKLIHLDYDVAKQAEFGEMVIRRLGFDLDKAGRQDKSVHPFTTSFSVNDVRITTRFQQDYFPTALFGSMHEAGHGMYEQGSAQALDGTWLAGGTS
ncbi:MAG: carboxypeptidase M32, partial [Anaerolineae bacterium]|nr:carboxypeptidase M32 [Anaerolineae bacterium]